MNAPSVTPSRGWERVVSHLDRGTILVLGAPGSGKTTLARWMLGQLDRGLDRVAVVDCDPGASAIGVPGCLGMALTGPWQAPAAMWFVGDVTPPGRLLPAVIGAARLAERARQRGAQAVIVDASGVVEGATARALHYHLALASGVDQVVALERQGELEPLLSLLSGAGRRIDRLSVSSAARPRREEELQSRREARFAAHLVGAKTRLFSPRRLLGRDWTAGTDGGGAGTEATLAEGTVVGLLDGEGFCLGLGLVEEVHPDRVAVLTRVGDVPVVRLQVGDFRLDPEGREIGRAVGVAAGTSG
ncbi:MAG TPA: Clp1/GlmU family protein [Thermoanaerobaculia bacterium]|nr:Clp1/GlmU family protein [Thermoanaerobaculia bacterium]